jgi:hypothetical protein
MGRIVKTTKKQIVEYWQNVMPYPETDLNFDWSDAGIVCWNCGTITNHVQKCHIIPHMLGGEDTPSNYVLLCGECHLEAPDIEDSNAMWEWIKSNRTSTGLIGSYKFEKILKEFERRNGYSFIEKLLKLENPVEKFNLMLKNNINKVGYHNGIVKITTYAMLFEKFIKENEKH